MSVCLDRIYKNEALRAHFEATIESGNLPHAMIFEGGCGSGRYTLAREIAAALCCQNSQRPCRHCDNCRKTDSLLNPDIITMGLPEGKATISVEQVREIKSAALTYPSEGEYKIFIIRDAEKMTVQAQNAFLKILEEPPSFVVFILICTNSTLMLPTVISRAPVFRMQRFTYEELCAYFEGDDRAERMRTSDPEGYSYMIRSADGAIGRALENMDKRSIGKSTKRYESLLSFFDALCGSDKAEFISREEDISSKKRDEFDSYIADIRIALRDIMAVRCNAASEMLFFAAAHKPSEYASALTLGAVTDMIECCDSAMISNERNANLNLLKINFMSDMWRYAHS